MIKNDFFIEPKLKWYEYAVPFVTGITLITTMQFSTALVVTFCFVGISNLIDKKYGKKM